MNKPSETLALALDALGMGYAPVPIVEGTKIPAVKWREFQTTLPSEDLVREWFAVRRNIAIVTSGMVVFDCDAPELTELVLKHCGDTPHKVRTPRGGMHLGFRRRAGVVLGNQVKIKGLDLDIRTFGGIELIPSSETEHGRYEWLSSGLRPVSELPCGNIGWTRERTKKRVQSIVVESSPDVLVRRARAWLACVEGAISGRNGHSRTFRVACKLTHAFPQGFGLNFEQAWPLIKEWNEQCEPPWSDPELTHKLTDAIGKIR